MAYVAIADRDVHLHDPQTFVTKYIWSQDHKVIAIQYSIGPLHFLNFHPKTSL